MKLYATITSERATKGQGGRFLDIEVMDENKEKFLSINIDYRVDGNIGILSRGALVAERIHYPEIKKKGKQQKGGVCYCDESGLSVPHDSRDH